MNIIKKSLLVGMSIVTILSVAGCHSNSGNKSDSVGDDNSETYESYEEYKEKSKIKLDKSNPVVINYDYEDYTKIQDEIKDNKLKAEEKYLNKTVKVTSQLSTIKTNGNTIIVYLTSSNDIGGIVLEFERTDEIKSKLLSLKQYDKSTKTEGDIVTVYGYCSEFDGLKLKLTNCEFEE